MIDNGLFPVEQNIKLSENSDTWAESITSIVSRKYPDLAQYINKVDFQKVEKTIGFAVGYISMDREGLRIPFIIEKFTLKPLDVFIKDNKYGYLNKDNAKKIAVTSWPFGATVNTGIDRGGHIKTSSVIHITQEQIEQDEALLKTAAIVAEKFPNVIASISNSMTNQSELSDLEASPRGVEKIAHLQISHSKDCIEMIHFGIPDEQFTIKTASERFGNNAVQQLMDLGIIRVPMENLQVSSSELPTEIFNDNKNEDTRYPRTLNISDGFGGFLRGNLYEMFDIKKPENKRGVVFLTTRSKLPFYDILTAYNTDHKLYNTPEVGILDDLVDDMSRPSVDLKPEMAAAIMMESKIYGPFGVRSESRMGEDKIYSIMDGFDADIVRLHITKKVKCPVIDGDDVYFPANDCRLIWLGKPVKQKPFEKTAAMSVRVIPSVDKQHFNLIDNGVTGLPQTALQNMNKTRAITALMHAGLTENESNAAIMSSLSKGSHEFQATPTATTSESVVRQTVKSEIPRLQKIASEIKRIIDFSGLVKIAVDLGGEQNVDLALGLRLVTPESIKKYRLLIPRIEETVDGLCKLMLAKRIGGDVLPVDESRIKSCISALTDIEYELTGV